MSNKTWVARLDDRFYPGLDNNWDDQMFRDRILEAINSTDHVMDVGAGAGIVPQMNFRGVAERICGIDPDERVVDNPYLDEGKKGFAEDIPYPADSFDLVFSDNVLEHLENPEEVFAEVARVLKPGGRLLVKTPNKRHYVALIARITPLWFHRYFNRLRGREVEDTFPTLYRANSTRDFERLAKASGLKLVKTSLIERRPEYLRISTITYLVGIAYERLVNKFNSLRGFRVLLIGEFEKPDSES